jgi:hypothetical protein
MLIMMAIIIIPGSAKPVVWLDGEDVVVDQTAWSWKGENIVISVWDNETRGIPIISGLVVPDDAITFRIHIGKYDSLGLRFRLEGYNPSKGKIFHGSGGLYYSTKHSPSPFHTSSMKFSRARLGLALVVDKITVNSWIFFNIAVICSNE